MIENDTEMPIGFGLSLAMHEDSMNRFSEMTDGEKRQVIEAARGVQSKQQMEELVASIAQLDRAL